MHIEIKNPEIEALILQCMQSGAFRSPEDLLRSVLQQPLSQRLAAELFSSKRCNLVRTLNWKHGSRALVSGEASRRPKQTRFGKELVDSARQILAHMRGEIELPTRQIIVSDEVGVSAVDTERPQ